MTTRVEQARADGRRRLHDELGRPALYIYASEDPVDVTVRVHDKTTLTGDIPGLDTVETRDESLRLRFHTSEISSFRRNAYVSISSTEAYQLGEAFPAHGATIDVSAIRLSAAEITAAALPTP